MNVQKNADGNNEMLFARLDDYSRRAGRGELGITCFLSPREQHFAHGHLLRGGNIFAAFGGFDTAERKRIFILPDFISRDTTYKELCFYGGDCIGAVRIKGSTYRVLTHRDFLGSLLGLGLERDVIGDIAVDEDGFGAVVICDTNVIPFIVSELKKVASDTVKTTEYAVPRDFEVKTKFSRISDTVASARVDCIIAALCNLSREKAREQINSGTVEIEYETETRPDRIVSAPCTVSVRGYGKFRLNSVSDITKKGRLRLDADKYT